MEGIKLERQMKLIARNILINLIRNGISNHDVAIKVIDAHIQEELLAKQLNTKEVITYLESYIKNLELIIKGDVIFQ